MNPPCSDAICERAQHALWGFKSMLSRFPPPAPSQIAARWKLYTEKYKL